MLFIQSTVARRVSGVERFADLDEIPAVSCN
ncbi:hypothetical protein ZHAWSFBX_CDS_0028 [Agrobacterium phage Alfirin]|nr:hypothetical protein ZHAWSFBX_CDS_0028 [Agrobacterium phage Alfirin]